MKSIRYTKFTGEDFGLSAEDLMRALADYFLNSGFNDPYMQFNEFNENSLEDLKRAIEEALLRGDFVDPEKAQQIQEALENMTGDQIEQMLDRMVQKLAEQGYINYEKYRGLILTDKGRAVAHRIQQRHATLSRFFSLFGLDAATQQADIEGIEHHLSTATVCCLADLAEFFEKNPETLRQFLNSRQNSKR